MFQSIVLVALQSPQKAGLAPLALRSLRAWLTSRHPQVSVGLHLVSPADVPLKSLILAIHRARPDAVGFWFDGVHDEHVDGVIHRLSPVLPSAVMFAFGPELASEDRAARVLRRHPGLGLAIRGEVEGPIDELCRRWQAGEALPDEPPPGISIALRRGVRHGPPAAPIDDTALLPSPWLTGAVEADEAVSLEVGRGPLPWADHLPRDAASAWRALPFSRLEAEIQRLVGEVGVPRLELVPAPADADPFLFQQLLTTLARHNRATQVHVGLAHLPEGPLTEALARAGVSQIFVDLPLESGRRGVGKELLTHVRARAAQLRDHGITLLVGLDVGHPGQSGDALRWTVDQLVSTGVGGVRLSPLRVPPGHAARRSARRRGMVIAAGAPDEVLAHRTLSFEDRTELLLDAELLSGYLPPWGSTLRAMARLVRRPATELARAMAAMGLGTPFEGAEAERLDHRHDELVSFLSTVLKAEGRMDRLPVLTALARFDRWRGEADRPGPLPAPITFEPSNLGQVVPITSPAISARSFSYDVVALSRGGAVEDAPVRRCHVLLHRLPNGVALPRQLGEIQRRALGLVDGARPVSMLVEALTDTPGFEGYDLEVMFDTYAQLMASGALIAAGTQAEPPAPSLRDNVLLFPGARGNGEEGEG